MLTIIIIIIVIIIKSANPQAQLSLFN